MIYSHFENGAAGDINLYRYVGNSTPNFTDPSGLAAGYAADSPGPRSAGGHLYVVDAYNHRIQKFDVEGQ